MQIVASLVLVMTAPSTSSVDGVAVPISACQETQLEITATIVALMIGDMINVRFHQVSCVTKFFIM